MSRGKRYGKEKLYSRYLYLYLPNEFKIKQIYYFNLLVTKSYYTRSHFR